MARIGERWEDRHSKPPTRKFTSITSLTAPINQVLMHIKDERALTFPDKLKKDPSKRLKDKYCCFHCDHGYDTAICYNLKQHIEALIRQGKQQRFVSKERTDPPQEQAPRRENKCPKPPLGDIRMIIGGTAITGLSKKPVRPTFEWSKTSSLRAPYLRWHGSTTPLSDSQKKMLGDSTTRMTTHLLLAYE